jgi:hypothetical protein
MVAKIAVLQKYRNCKIYFWLKLMNIALEVCCKVGCILFTYFPIQNLLKIFSSKSSVVMVPVISPR